MLTFDLSLFLALILQGQSNLVSFNHSIHFYS